MTNIESRIKEAFESVEMPPHLNEETLARIEEQRNCAEQCATNAGQAASANSAKQVSSSCVLPTAEGENEDCKHKPAPTPSSAPAASAKAKARAWRTPIFAAAACFALATIGVCATGFGQTGAADKGIAINENDASNNAIVQEEITAEKAETVTSASPVEDAAAFITLDMNPSIELALDENDIVLAATGINEDGVAVVEGMAASHVSLEGLPAQEALETLTACPVFTSYLQDDSYMALTVVCPNDRQRERILSATQRCLQGLPCQGSCYTATLAERTEAAEAGMGIQRYRCAQELLALDESLTWDDCKGMTMRELRDRLAEASGDERQTPIGRHGQGQGHQHRGNHDSFEG